MSEGWIKSTCAYCGVGCGIEARPMSNGLLEVRGDKEHPSNYGKLCTKGIALGDTVIHDGRLLAPKLKTEAGDWCDTEWDEALSLVAKGFSDTIEQFGPDSVAFYVSGQLLTEDYYVANKLIKGFLGTANIDSNSRLCMASTVVGHKRAFGMDTVPVCYEDLEKTDLVILVGSNLAWCHPVLFQRLRAAKQTNSNLKVIVIDPRRNESCEIADLHLAINPGSDVALFNGLLVHLGEHNLVDHAFISAATNGFSEAYQSALNGSEVSEVTGIDLASLQEFYECFSQTEKVITIYSQGVNQSSQGSDKVNSIINCHLATGKIGKEGAGPFSVTGQPNAMGGREVGALANTLTAHMEFHHDDIDRVEAFWQTDTLAKKPGLKAIDMFDAIHRGEIKAIWIMATNPIVSLPDSDKIKQALENCPLVVVSDCVENTATTPYADILLPAQGWSEKSGTVTNSERRISRQRRLLASPGMAKPDWWIISQVAQRIGFKEAFDYLHEGEIFREYAQLTTLGNADHGSKKARQRDLNLAGLVEITDSEYNSLTPQQWPVEHQQHQVVNQRMFADQRFFTENHRANFIAVKHTPPQASTTKVYPLVLNTGRSRDQWHTMTRTGLSSRLAEHASEPYVLIHPQTAMQYDLSNHEMVVVFNNNGECVVKVVTSDTMKPGELFVPIHWNEITGPLSKPCALVDSRTDTLSGQPEFKYTPVDIKPYDYQTSATVLVKDAILIGDVGYVARQKVDGGYLYRIRSPMEINELQMKIERLLPSSSSADKLICRDDSSIKGMAAVVENKVTSLYKLTKDEPSAQEVQALSALFNSSADEGSSLHPLLGN
ncbi:molybdopterin oxidoreductase family protein [Vibrio natriegens]|uniref:molybdopterin oxidoreductase family protein n=1 Tax=Vibrio natriegens TaxID=691 RepID=UPI000803EF8A|nr:nitrate reductase [Vibrio natriegens]ANQ19196.1 nitrate reductase [Vibrio natriegens]